MVDTAFDGATDKVECSRTMPQPDVQSAHRDHGQQRQLHDHVESVSAAGEDMARAARRGSFPSAVPEADDIEWRADRHAGGTRLIFAAHFGRRRPRRAAAGLQCRLNAAPQDPAGAYPCGPPPVSNRMALKYVQRRSRPSGLHRHEMAGTIQKRQKKGTLEMLKDGEKAPDFELPDETGAIGPAFQAEGRPPVVVYFYPRTTRPGARRRPRISPASPKNSPTPELRSSEFRR